MANGSSRPAVLTVLLLGVTLAALTSDTLGGTNKSTVNAQPALQASACSNATLSGAYGASGTGWIVRSPDGAPLDSPRPISAVALVNADGAGNFSLAQQNADRRTEVGKYSVNADCTFTVVVTNSVGIDEHWAGVIVDGGRKVFATFAQTNPVALFTWERI